MNIKRTLVIAGTALSLTLIPAAGASTAFADGEVPVYKYQCKDGGWVYYVDNLGQAFTNQGDCVSFLMPYKNYIPPVVD